MCICNQSPISTYHTIKMIFIAKQISYNSFVIREAHLLMPFIHWHTVIWHDRSSVNRESSFERNEMIIEIITWVYLSLLKRKMRIEPFFLRPATGKMFRPCSNTGGAELITLETEDICFCHFCRELCIFTKCS